MSAIRFYPKDVRHNFKSHTDAMQAAGVGGTASTIQKGKCSNSRCNLIGTPGVACQCNKGTYQHPEQVRLTV